MTSKTAARKIGMLMKVLVEAGVCTDYDTTVAAMTITPEGGTDERNAILDALREA